MIVILHSDVCSNPKPWIAYIKSGLEIQFQLKSNTSHEEIEQSKEKDIFYGDLLYDIYFWWACVD